MQKISSRTKLETIYIDCTATAFTGLNTGIQRLVRNVVARSLIVSEKTGAPCQPVVAAFGHFWPIRNIQHITRAHRASSLTINKLKGIMFYISNQTKKLATKVFGGSEIVHQVGDRIGLQAKRAARAAAKFILSVIFFLLLVGFMKRPVRFRDGDVLLLLDAFWIFGALSTLTKRYANSPVFVVPVICDLTPLSHPQFHDEGLVSVFQKMFPDLLRNSSGLLAISRTVLAEVDAYIKKNNLCGSELPKDYFYLGADIHQKGKKEINNRKVRKWPTELFAQKNTYLMVGTIEPRKGHDFVLDAFEKLWDEKSSSVLCIVGRPGWKCGNLLERIQNSEYLNKMLFFFSDVNDQELGQLYENATALIFASAVEGFGLPLVEAMQQGISVFASDIPVFREIGGNYPYYFDLGSSSNLVRAIHEFEDSGDEKNKQMSQEWLTWDESTALLAGKIELLFYNDHNP